MNVDYAGKKPRRRRKTNSRKKKPRALPPWLWLLTGLCLGLLISFLLHLASLPRTEPEVATGAAPVEDAESAEDEVEFNFYTLLPRREVLVAEDRQPSRAKPGDKTEAKATAAGSAGFSYYLQVGSFQARAEAEKRRVQLLLLNMEADIEKIRHQGKSWYRVQSGPYASAAQLASVRNRLSGEGIDTLVTKRKLD